jgi:hypothetical protein
MLIFPRAKAVEILDRVCLFSFKNSGLLSLPTTEKSAVLN